MPLRSRPLPQGLALCSTSLGTTSTVLKTSDLASTRLGVVLTCAAMMDDVIGLVMVQVISNLGASPAGFSYTTVLRPILVSAAFAIILPLFCAYVIRPLTTWSKSSHLRYPMKYSKKYSWKMSMAFVCHTATLLSFMASASYAGTSNLFAAYLAGASISWWDDFNVAELHNLEESRESRAAMARRVLEEKANAGLPRRETAATSSNSSSEDPASLELTRVEEDNDARSPATEQKE